MTALGPALERHAVRHPPGARAGLRAIRRADGARRSHDIARAPERFDVVER